MAVDTRSAAPPALREPGVPARRWPALPPWPALLPVVFAAANGLAFYLIRPDQHVAWRGDQEPPEPVDLIDLIRGARTERS